MSNENNIPTDPPEYPIANCYSMSVPRAVYSNEECRQIENAFTKAVASALSRCWTNPAPPATSN